MQRVEDGDASPVPVAVLLGREGSEPMTGCSIQRETEGGLTVIRVAGVFDRASAFELRDRLEREPASDLVLDFSLVREFADLGVATLAHGLAGADRRLHLRGLRQHQLRIFRYFGLDVDALHDGRRARH